MALEYINPLNLLRTRTSGEELDPALANPVTAAYRYLLEPYGQGADVQSAQLFTPTTTQTTGGAQDYGYAPSTQQAAYNLAQQTMYPGGTAGMGQFGGGEMGALGAAGAAFPYSSRQMAEMANQAAMRNPNIVSDVTGGAQVGTQTMAQPGAESQISTAVQPGTQGALTAATQQGADMGTMRTAQGVQTGGQGAGNLASRAQVLEAYASNPLAQLNPSEEAINYWMKTGLGSFNDVVRSYRQANPAEAAKIDAERTKQISDAQAALDRQAAGQYNIGQNIGKASPSANIKIDQYGNYGVTTGSLEDRIFRMFGDAVGRYTSKQISPNEVANFANQVRAGTLKESDVPAAIQAAESKRQADMAALQAQTKTSLPTVLDRYFEKPLTGADLDKAAQNASFSVGSSPYGQEIRSGQIGVTIGDDGTPRGLAYYDKSGKLLTGSAFNPREFLRNAQEFNINPTDLLGIEKGLKTNKIGYMPYEMYGGGGDLGFDIRDLLSGGLGSASNWLDYVKNYQPTGVNAGTDMFNKQYLDLANRYGLKYNQDKYKGGGIDPSRVTAVSAEGVEPKNWAMISGDVVSMYDTEAEAQAAAKQYGGQAVNVGSRGVSNLDNPNRLVKDDKGNWILKPPGGATGGGFYVEDGQGHFGQQSPLGQIGNLYRR